MPDVLARLLVVVAVVAAAVVAAAVGRRGGARRRRRAALPGLAPGVYLFTSATCSTCPAARTELTAALGAGGFEEIAYETRPDDFARCGVERVPVLAVVGPGGGGWRADGVVPARRLRRWILERPATAS